MFPPSISDNRITARILPGENAATGELLRKFCCGNVLSLKLKENSSQSISKVIYQGRGRVFHQVIQTPRSVLENEAVGRVFLTTSRCLDNLMKHSSKCLI